MQADRGHPAYLWWGLWPARATRAVVDMALQVVPERMRGQSRQTTLGGRASAASVSVSGGCPSSAGHGTGSGGCGMSAKRVKTQLSQAPSLTPMPRGLWFLEVYPIPWGQAMALSNG